MATVSEGTLIDFHDDSTPTPQPQPQPVIVDESPAGGSLGGEESQIGTPDVGTPVPAAATTTTTIDTSPSTFHAKHRNISQGTFAFSHFCMFAIYSFRF